MKKSIHSITVNFEIDPGLMWMRHINHDIMMERITKEKTNLKDLDSKGYKIKPKVYNYNIMGYTIDFYDQATLNAYLIMKE